MIQTDIVPRKYQVEGITFLQSRKRAMLTDAPGLGKTIQGALAAEPPVLVVAPNYLVEHWDEWLHEHIFTDGMGYVENADDYAWAEWYAPRNARAQSIAVAEGTWLKKNAALKERADWTIINVQMLRTHIKELVKYKYKTVIFDESHHLRNRKAEQSKGAAKVAAKAEYVFHLTASPVWKELDDLYMQLHILHPEIFTSYWNFVDAFCLTETTGFGTKILGVKKDNIEELEELLVHVRLGRSYEDAGREVPPLITKYIKLEFPERYKKLYTQTMNYWIGELEMQMAHPSQVMHALRAITSYQGKVDAVVDTILDSVGSSVVFVWYRDLAREIAKALRAKGLDAIAITGEDPAQMRKAMAKNHKHVVATIASLSEGIDLSHANTVIFAEEHWPPGSTYQALSRVRRERQEGDNSKPVVVYYVHVKGTIDESIHAVSKRRTATIRDVVGEALGLDLSDTKP